MELITDKDKLKTFILSTNYNEYSNSIEKYVEFISKEYNKVSNKLKDFNKSLQTLSDYNIMYDKESVDSVLNTINNENNVIKEHIELVKSYIQEKQDNCEHDFVYDGHDSHYDYYTCKKCGKSCKC